MDIAHELPTVVGADDEPPRSVLRVQPDVAGGLAAVEAVWAAPATVASRDDGGRVLYRDVFKRWIDFVVAGLLLMAFSPLLAALATAVRLDSRGPIIFRQTRIGLGGRPFVVYKFRSMAPVWTNALVLFAGSDGQLRHKIRDDPRVTRVGRLLRRTSLDELPQLVNVVRGEMSLVGPRPELPAIVAEYAPWQHQRHQVRPGITGWWQVQGRSELPMHEHTELDIYYVEHVSLGLDLRILWKTMRVVFSGHGAF